MKYFPGEIEKKWQKKWAEDKLYSPDLDRAKKPYFALMMFPYPSAEGLHVGNMYAFTGADIFARYMRMKGYDVFEPIGLDGFGIHSENYAIKINKHPFDLSKITEKRFYEQLMSIGNSFDWTRTVETYKSEYYRWTQWIFLQMYKNGLAYRKTADVNWCPSCKTVLADEQVIAGKCERCSSIVGKKQLEQWFFRITKYADRLLKNLETLDWSEKVLIAQRNWIGKSDGMIIEFRIQNIEHRIDNIEIFTTKPETVDGATFLVLAPEHPKIKELVTGENRAAVNEYISKANKKTPQDRVDVKDKTGVFTGSYVVNPVTGKKIPVWVADYVLVEYGTSAIMAVPDGDERDLEFARKFNLPIEKTSHKAKPKGRKQIHYHLRDWLISRQRYWGPPIPIIYCDLSSDGCGIVPVPEEELPVVLPHVENFRPTGTGVSPLASIDKFYKVKCPKCGKNARRETDVSDTFLDSAWYFFRYTSTDDAKHAWSKDRVKKWLPINMYIGGAEHSVLHLLYSRFLAMAFKDMGLISDFEEPFIRFRAHGLLISEGAKMSKSKGNIVNPDEYISQYGADTLRLYLMFLGPFDQGGDFRDQAISGPYGFIKRICELADKVDVKTGEDSLNKQNKQWMSKTIAKVTSDITNLKYNTAIAAMMEWLNYLSKKEKISKQEYKTLLLLLSPFAPHVAEELWQKMGEKYSIHRQPWPKYDEKYLVPDTVKIPVQVNGKLRAVLDIDRAKSDQEEAVKAALENEKVKNYLRGKKYKVKYVKGKILNFILD